MSISVRTEGVVVVVVVVVEAVGGDASHFFLTCVFTSCVP
jgi:hypothetical protein